LAAWRQDAPASISLSTRTLRSNDRAVAISAGLHNSDCITRFGGIDSDKDLTTFLHGSPSVR
jgi:hypothetical protein